MRIFIIFFLPCISAQVSRNIPKLFVIGKNNVSYRVDGYSSYTNYLNGVDGLVSHKIKDAYEFALNYSKKNSTPSVFFSQTTPEKLILLQLLQSFNLKSRTFDKFLLNVANLCTFNTPKNFRTWVENNFDFLPDMVYQIFKFMASTEPVLHKAIAVQIFYLNIKHKVLEKAVAIGDIDVVKWLLEHSPDDDVNFSVESKKQFSTKTVEDAQDFYNRRHGCSR